jgi:hypothetical protein
MSVKDVRTVSASNHAAEMDIRRKTDGEPSTNQIKSGKLPQNRIDNMVSRKQQLINEKAKAKAAAAKAAAEEEAAGLNITQDLPMNDGNQGDTISRESVGSKRFRDGTVANNDEAGTRTSVTHMGTDGIEVPTMGGSAERQIGTQMSAQAADSSSSLAASVAAEVNNATVTTDASVTSINALGQTLVQGNVSESKDEAMGDAGRVTQLETNAINDSDSSFTEGGTSTANDNNESKTRRKLEDWVIPNPVDTALHPTMDLPGKRIKITNELAGQQLTEALNQHALNLNTLVPLIEAWDTTLTVYDGALTAEIERRRLRIQGLDDLCGRILQKQHANSTAIPLP